MHPTHAKGQGLSDLSLQGRGCFQTPCLSYPKDFSSLERPPHFLRVWPLGNRPRQCPLCACARCREPLYLRLFTDQSSHPHPPPRPNLQL